MSELTNNSDKRVQDLLAFSLGMMNGENGAELIERYKEAIEKVTPYDMLKLEDKQLEMGISPEDIKRDIEKIINVLFKSLNSYQWEKPKQGSFLYYLMLENDAFTYKLNQIKKILRSYKGREQSDFATLSQELLPRFKEFEQFEYHYIKKENILFPYLEKNWTSYRPLKVMWSIHDDIRRSLKKLIAMLDDKSTQWQEFNILIGKYFSLVFRMFQKENIILFPVASSSVSKDAWQTMHIQSFEYPFPFIDSPQKPSSNAAPQAAEQPLGAISNTFVSETGNLSTEQALLIFNNLPVDITVVDENDKVLFFNKAKERFFPRSPAIVGRSVQNCHPPESVHVVEKIIAAFRSGEKDKADFWIQMRGRFILIQYFALRNPKGEYKGVLEVSQDATETRGLQGEKRLLSWE